MAYRFQVTFDSVSPHELADWWAAALGWQVEPSDEAFIRRMIDEGHATAADTTTHNGVLVWREGAAVSPPESLTGAPRLFFQQVPEAKQGKNRLHLDVRSGDDDAAEVVRRLQGLGASVLGEGRQGPHSWTVMADPQGNEFCLSD